MRPGLPGAPWVGCPGVATEAVVPGSVRSCGHGGSLSSIAPEVMVANSRSELGVRRTLGLTPALWSTERWGPSHHGHLSGTMSAPVMIASWLHGRLGRAPATLIGAIRRPARCAPSSWLARRDSGRAVSSVRVPSTPTSPARSIILCGNRSRKTWTAFWLAGRRSSRSKAR